MGIDLAREILTGQDAECFAEAVVLGKEQPSGDCMEWVRAARSVLSHVIQAFQQEAPQNWTLMDVLEAGQEEETLCDVLKMTRDGRSIVRDTLGVKKQAKGVMMTLKSNIKTLKPVAAAMSHARNISLKDWITGRGIIVLQHMHKYQDAMHGFENWVFDQAVRYVLAEEGSPAKRTTFFLDEAERAPFGRQLIELATRGRSRGTGLVLGFRSASRFVDGMGRQAEEVLAMCATKVFMSVVEGPVTSPAEFMDLPPAQVHPEQGLTITAIVTMPHQEAMKMITTHMDSDGVSLKRDLTIPAFVERPRSELEL